MISNFSVPNPCSESWNGMQPKENGRYCGSCQKVVIDFTNKTNEEILAYLAANSGKKMCGTFKTRQLPAPQQQPVKNERVIRFLAAALLVFGMTLFSCNPGTEQKEQKEQEEAQSLPMQTTGIMLVPPNNTNLQHTPADTPKQAEIKFTIPEIEPGASSGSTITGDIMMPEPVESAPGLMTVSATSDTNEVYTIAETMPEFPGGRVAMMEYLQENLRYPEIAKEIAIAGTIYVSFVVKKDGSIGDVKIVRGIHPDLDKEAMRVVKSMPDWSPGTTNGKKVNTRFNLPVKIHLR